MRIRAPNWGVETWKMNRACGILELHLSFEKIVMVRIDVLM